MTLLPGFTNIVHRDTDTVIRQGRPFAALLGIDRRREANVLQRIGHLDIGPELLSIDHAQDRTIFRAIRGVSLEGRPTSRRLLVESLRVLSRLHAQPADGAPFRASALIRHYLGLTSVGSDLRDLCERQADIADHLERSSTLALCHNDCVAKNWILQPDGTLKLIDFEFAAPNDPAFDLATWCLAFGVRPEHPLLNGHPAASRIRTYVPIVDVLWSLFCQVLASRSGHEIPTATRQMETRMRRLTHPQLFFDRKFEPATEKSRVEMP